MIAWYGKWLKMVIQNIHYKILILNMAIVLISIKNLFNLLKQMYQGRVLQHKYDEDNVLEQSNFLAKLSTI